jgi:type IV pilus assembly protein PilM
MKLFDTVGDFFALDIGATALRVVQLRRSGHNWALVRYGAAPIDVKISMSDSTEDQRRLGDAIMALVTHAGLSSRNVVLGIPSNKMFATVVDLPKLSPQELSNTIKYQADQFIPMSTEEAKIDWSVLGNSPRDPQKDEVLLAGVSNKFSEQRLELLEGLGFNVIAIEPDALALTRALVPAGNNDAMILLDLGDYATDLVAVLGGTPRLVRSIPVGGKSFVKAAMQNLNIDENQAQQFIYKFGLHPDKLEGQIYRALESTIEQLYTEVEKSIKFFQTRYTESPIKNVVLSGAGAILPGFGEFITGKSNIQVVVGNAWQNVSYPGNMQEELVKVGHTFGVVVGLAERMS